MLSKKEIEELKGPLYPEWLKGWEIGRKEFEDQGLISKKETTLTAAEFCKRMDKTINMLKKLGPSVAEIEQARILRKQKALKKRYGLISPLLHGVGTVSIQKSQERETEREELTEALKELQTKAEEYGLNMCFEESIKEVMKSLKGTNPEQFYSGMYEFVRAFKEILSTGKRVTPLHDEKPPAKQILEDEEEEEEEEG